ncbi:metallophosphoesterase [Ancylomarina salipaludis]|uniref:Metallophosphoesterase n=1 Tax=Ancylomarina salipaludis TaxID=2501299 RepID=A0A4Q1JIY6_9BACT|nr:metallophosphoesterase [Ancylomarina salipaludis]RXQ89530.1 metallophosphoesterase [Ancylomarina salipaludis]
MRRREFVKMSGILGMLTLTGVLPACNLPFEYSPYDIIVEKEFRDLTAKNLAKLKAIDAGKSSLKIALISDTHTFYDEFEEAVKALNARDDIDFVIHAGDLTLSALHKEYTWFNEIMSKLNKPFITVIGNHDYLSNGKAIYEKSFGPGNYTFTFRGCKFVMFDNNIWENKNNDPEFDWFKANLENDGDYNFVIPVSHIPPWADQYNYGNEHVFNEMMEENDIQLSLHGHTHSFYHGKRYDQVDYLVVGDIADKAYAIISIDEDSYSIEKVSF